MSKMKTIIAPNRRQILGGLAATAAAAGSTGAWAATPSLTFEELYGKVSVLGLEFSAKVNALEGRAVAMRGFMAPPLKAEANFFVLTKIPMALCPFCSSDADWPDDIVVVYLGKKQTFVQPSTTIEVHGKLEAGSWTDPETGFVSLLRIRDAQYSVV
ncbi:MULTISPECIES: hypothetical protein [unclassified Chelatococcus]|uniref:hypothetical protein n=1 Tax=unclassified Chelatococcus TaxID=2638111 RepID=UPI001BCF513E|nr:MULTISPECIES: hypothetical protein [unclassified Chelatococcus]CAH1648005.1 conserved exported hypothetical protein [Hyphomicrobiales bacterium]MBS7742100.1 hypothetical protein [Chelatococcus sp. HY11]MBX3542782.1 hypothetical protein [Chelatococcus sp.]MCO5075003.1 hypothetical protein [Chelatococcus sp.]CAH1690193.1 conserved exported hypothetical protein [Hyphomicrobiales bacterium]